jgi:hypothetical protein
MSQEAFESKTKGRSASAIDMLYPSTFVGLEIVDHDDAIIHEVRTCFYHWTAFLQFYMIIPYTCIIIVFPIL